ncbi:uncharacterized protein OCT59_024540 [Rhizophagus irregularis]|nr:hypothetical protein OCT59_024540 [Rhizophagus irregularis]GBC14360.1 right-handed parallel beta-helix repeat-containing protein [ [Rhizophagus irregularis DAOM 181602=DAOM 197198]
MSRFTPSKPLFKDSKAIDNYVLYNFGQKPTSGQIKHYWLSIAKMYFSVENYSMTAEFLFRLILISPQNYEALELLGTTYRKQGQLSNALEYYERALSTPNAPQTLAHDAAELCIQLVKKQKEESEIKNLMTKALYWIERKRSLNNNKYDPQAVQLLQKIYVILVRHAEKQLDKRSCLKRREGIPPVVNIKWIDESVKDLISSEETLIDPLLHILLTKSLLKIQDYQRAWKHVMQRRYNFVDSLEWNTFVKTTFPKYKLEATIDNQKEPLHEPTELIFFANDNVVRLSLNMRLPEESDKLVNEFSELVKTWEIPKSQNAQLLEKWTRFQQEYLSRSLRHDGYFQLYLSTSDLIQFQNASTIQKNQDHLNVAYLKFKSCLYFRRETFRDPARPISHFIYLMCQRISDVSHQLLVLLQCFDYSWLNKKEEADNIFRLCSENEDNITQNFVLPGHKKFLKILYKEVGKENLTESSTLKWLSKMALQVDKIAFCAPYDLDRFLMAATWYIENGEIRDLLRHIFPNLQDCLKIKDPEKPANKQESPVNALASLFENLSTRDRLLTNWEKFLSERNVTTMKNSIVEIPTLVDIEFFLLILLIQRQYHCIIRLGAETLGQILYLASKGCWKASTNQKKFWRTLLSFYGKNDPDKRIYTGDLMSNEEFTQCLREIRGDINMQDYDYIDDQVVNLQKDLFLIMAVLYKSMITHHRKSRSAEGLRCLEIHQDWSKKVSASFSLSEKLIIFDTEIEEPGYRMFIPDNKDPGANDLTEHLSSIFSQDELVVQQEDVSIDDFDTILEEDSVIHQTVIPFEDKKDGDDENVKPIIKRVVISTEPLKQEEDIIPNELSTELLKQEEDIIPNELSTEPLKQEEDIIPNELSTEPLKQEEDIIPNELSTEPLKQEEDIIPNELSTEPLKQNKDIIPNEITNEVELAGFDDNLEPSENLDEQYPSMSFSSKEVFDIQDDDDDDDDVDLSQDEDLIQSGQDIPIHLKPSAGADTSFVSFDNNQFEENLEASMIENAGDDNSFKDNAPKVDDSLNNS